MVNIQKEVEEYVKIHPFVRIALFENLINYSKLSRRIIRDLKLEHSDIDAIIVACRRVYSKHNKKINKEQISIKDILESTSLQIKNKVSVIILSSNTPDEKIDALRKSVEEVNKNNNQKEILHIIRGVSVITIITSDDIACRVCKTFSRFLIKETSNLVEVILKSSARLEEVPGVIAHLYSLLAENGINIVETMSCWTDTILVINQKDLGLTIDLLSF
jgi:predicted regulator of amino acid metabolism with ACT domain